MVSECCNGLDWEPDVLVSVLRPAKRLADLTAAELADLSLCVQRVSKAVETHFQGTSVTVAVQDGPDSGQTVEVHPSIMPLMNCLHVAWLSL